MKKGEVDNEINSFSFLIKTFEREESLILLLASIAKHFPEHEIVIVDDSRVSYRDSILSRFPFLRIDYIVLPFDSGVSKGRQEGLKKISNEYFVLCDDDFIILDKYLNYVYSYMVKSNIDIVGGSYIDNPSLSFGIMYAIKSILKFKWGDMFRFLGKPKIRRYEGFLTETEEISSILTEEERLEEYCRCDFVLNFFIANTKRVLDFGGWDNLPKIGTEHLKFFARMRRGHAKVEFCNKLQVRHRPIFSPFYILMRYLRQGRT